MSGPAERPSGVPSDVSDEILLARAYLSRVAEPGCVPLWQLVGELGPVAAADQVRRGTAPAAVVRATAARRDADPRDDLEAAARLGIRLVAPESAYWPAYAFGALDRAAAARAAAWQAGARRRDESGEPVPPLALWVRGAATADLAGLGWRSVAVVGARAATAYGEHVAKEFAHELAGRSVTVVSGGAYGIDAAAHRGALAAHGTTVLVSAGGLDRPYPPGNAPLFDRVAETGLLVSESPPGCAPQRHRFLSRNRLIAAFSTGVLVVEAARRSGAANTAAHARALGRPVMAVPGPVTSPMSLGCHELIREGALLVSRADDVLAVVGSLGEGIDVAAAEVTDVRAELDRLDPSARRVFEGLPTRGWATPEQIAVRAGVSALEVVRALPALDLAGLVETGDGGHRLAARWRRGATTTPDTAAG